MAPPTDIDVAVLNQTPGAAELLPFRDKQCLVMTHEDLFPILSYRCAQPTTQLHPAHPPGILSLICSHDSFAICMWPGTSILNIQVVISLKACACGACTKHMHVEAACGLCTRLSLNPSNLSLSH